MQNRIAGHKSYETKNLASGLTISISTNVALGLGKSALRMEP